MQHKLTKMITGVTLLGVIAAPALQATAQAAPDHGRHKGWTQGQHRGWDKNHNMDARERRQDNRIYQGVRNGSLNHREYNRLERREDRIDRVEARDRRSGGRLTPQERRNIQRRLNSTNRAIYNQKHDAQHRHHDRD